MASTRVTVREHVYPACLWPI